MSQTVQRLFWGWDTPVLEKAVAFLCHGWQGPKALDLSDTLLLVPNGEAGRRLREALAYETDRAGSAAVVPHLWLPEQALLPQACRAQAATPLQSQMAWQRALERTDMTALQALFPALSASSAASWGWRADTARMLAELKMLLGTGGLTFADTAAHAAAERDAERWQELAVLEQAYFQELSAVGVQDAQVLKRELARKPVVPEGLRRVLVLVSPDLPPLLNDWLRALAEQGLQVSVAIHAPAEHSATFDDFGRPLPAYWGEDADTALPISHEQLHVTRDPSEQAMRALELMRALVPKDSTALGVCDAETAALVVEKLTLEDARSYEPGGEPVQKEGLWHVLESFRILLGAGSWRAFAALLRVDEVREALAPDVVEETATPAEATPTEPRKVSAYRLLKQADEFTANHLPVSLAHALELPLPDYPELAATVQTTQRFITTLRSLPTAKAARMLILRLLGEKTFKPEAPGHRERTELATEWLRVCEELDAEAQRFGLSPQPEEAFSLSLQLLSQSRLAEPRGEIDLVLQGWLELLWERAPHLIVAGMNEEHVPGIFISHPFLPDALRQALGLPCQQTRFARDAYTLAVLAHTRASRGRLELLCGQWSEDGDALRPSRLLFLCPDTALPDRVAHLFPTTEEQKGTAEPARSLAWRLRPDWTPQPLEVISPSRLRDYLTCPFRFFLTHVRRMSPVEPQQRELDAAEFGRVIHEAFHHLFKDADMRQCTHPGKIADFLEEAARQEVRRRFGQHPAPLVLLQADSLVQRLRQAAVVEATSRQTGWECLEAELKIGHPEDALPLLLEGARLAGRIDRVERHVSGAVRIVDFKTSDKTDKPDKRHYRKITNRMRLREEDAWKTFELPQGERGLWLDLQLPLYAAALRQRGLDVSQVAYLALPKSVQSTELSEWKGFDAAIIEAAVTCAEEAVRRIRAGQHWPPAERSPDTTFDELLLHDPLHSVEAPPRP